MTTDARKQDAETRPRKRGPIARVLVPLLQAALTLALLAGGIYAAYWFNATEGTVAPSGGEGQEASRLVEVVDARLGDHPVRVRAMGTVIPAREAVIRPRVAGMIVEQAPDFVPGGFFREGEFMLQIERTDYEQAILQAESDLARAEATLQIELGDQAVAREELELLELDIPEINRDLILRIPQVNQARAEVKSAEAAVRRAELELERTRIAAPFDGQLVERSVNVGNNVAPGDALATFVGADEYWVEISVPVSALRWIEAPRTSEAQPSRAFIRDARAWGRGVERDAEVAQVIGRLEERSRLARVIIRVPDPLGREGEPADRPELLLDAFVEAEVEGRTLEDSFVIERDLVREDDTVWVMNDDDRLTTKPVTIAYRGRHHVYITDGLADGDRVIRTNLQTPVEGMLLREARRVDEALTELPRD